MNADVHDSGGLVGEAMLTAAVSQPDFEKFSDRVGFAKIKNVIRSQVDRYVPELIELYGEKARMVMTALILYSFSSCNSGKILSESPHFCVAKLDSPVLSPVLPRKFEWIKKRVKGLFAEACDRWPAEPHKTRENFVAHEVAKTLLLIDHETREELQHAFTRYYDNESLRGAEGKLRSAVSSLLQGTAIESDDESAQATLAQPKRITIQGQKYDLTDIHTPEGVEKTPAGGAYKMLKEEVD